MEDHQTKKYSSIRKCRFVFKFAALRYKAIRSKNSEDIVLKFEKLLEELDSAIKAKNLPRSQELAYEVDLFIQQYAKKTMFDHAREFAFALVIALIIAAFVRQMWFELYEIPTGSMRPTFKESDRVLVFKNSYGINTPFMTSHLYFEPNLIHRGNIIVLTGDGLDLPDVDTTYFLLFPGKKRYVKRCLGKPGDTLYFYGGQVWGISKDGSDIFPFDTSTMYKGLEYIPITSFEGRQPLQVETDTYGREIYTLKQMNLPLARIIVSQSKDIIGEIKTQDGWAREALASKAIGNTPQTYNQFWGIQNYATARLLEPYQLPIEARQLGYQDDNAKLYLELKHSPTLPTRIGRLSSKSLSKLPLVHTKTTWLPIDEESLKAISDALYTVRFYVKDGKAYRYTQEGRMPSYSILLKKDVPDGCYEFYEGIAYSIGWGGIAKELPKDHPIYPTSEKYLKLLYNCGIDFLPDAKTMTDIDDVMSNRSRYVYFRDGSLYIMGSPILTKGSKTLTTFDLKETRRAREYVDYIPFKDMGPPLKDGVCDKEKIMQFGLKIPDGYYLALGDNHAMSLDSRYFGFVPENNLQGSPAWIFWPPGNRWGAPPQPSYPFFRVSNIVILGFVIVAGSISYKIYNDRISYTGIMRRKKKRQKNA